MTIITRCDLLVRVTSAQRGRGRPVEIHGSCQGSDRCHAPAVRRFDGIAVCNRCRSRLQRAKAKRCSREGCTRQRVWNKKSKNPGYCREHERDFLIEHPRLLATLDYVGNNIVEQAGCWDWLRDPEDDNPGRTYSRGKIRMGNFDWLPYRFVYVITVGVIPTGYEIDHLCGVRTCILPTHLEPVLPSVNQQREALRREGLLNRRESIEHRTEALLGENADEETAQSILSLAKRIYPEVNRLVLAARLVSGFEPRTPDT